MCTSHFMSSPSWFRPQAKIRRQMLDPPEFIRFEQVSAVQRQDRPALDAASGICFHVWRPRFGRSATSAPSRGKPSTDTAWRSFGALSGSPSFCA
jgi:hypothetical protein